MLAAFMLYATVLSVVIGVLAVLMERAAAQLRWSLRWVWLIAMVAMVLMPTVMRLKTHREPSANDRIVPPVSVSRITANLPDAAPEALPQALTVAAPAAVTERPVRVPHESMTTHWQRVLDQLIERTATADHLLLCVWALLTGGLAVRVGRGLWRLRILPRSLEQRSVQGTTVYLTERLGPAVIGGTGSAIVLPRWVLQLDHVLLALVLQHEREHVKARDSRVLAIGLVLLVLMPWHAPLWWAWQRLRLAIEVDCDARVLRADGNVKRYAQLLLLMSQQRRAQGPVSFGDALTSPLLLAFNPQFHHLTQRINAMTARPSKHPLRLLTIGLASAVVATLAVAIPAPPKVAVASAPIRAATSRPREAVLIKVTRLGMQLASPPVAGTAPVEIVIYGTGAARVGIGTASLTLLGDTIRLDHLPAFTADVSAGDVHVELRRTAGTVELGGDVTGGAVSTFTIRARHVVLSKRGVGVAETASPLAPAASRSIVPEAVQGPVAREADVESLARRSIDQLFAGVPISAAQRREAEAVARSGIRRARDGALELRLSRTPREAQTFSVFSGLSAFPQAVTVVCRTLGSDVTCEISAPLRAPASPLASATQWDSLAARRSSIELQRVTVLMTYEPRFARLQEIDRTLAELDDALRALPSESAWNVLEIVTRALGARTEVLLAARKRLSADGKRSTTEFAAIDAERDLLRERTLALRRLQVQWRPPLKPYAMRSVVSEAEAAAQSSRAPAPSLKH
ncbi:M56 family metallopeptidase [Gemmatimonas sp.]|jgi:beta-lactamase regulating signal transducer with metallopeptidase domain|uniref:M56 family metallopeptidase n=1 Tax=Gemmatimonas sp. TaxID=1962908 RepID=UPI0037BF3828